MAIFIQPTEIDREFFVRLKGSLALGKGAIASGKAPAVKRSDRADQLFLESDDPRIQSLGESSCQVLFKRDGSSFFVEDLNPDGNCCHIGGELFTRKKLLINDRISIGENFHFVFDGIGLRRVPDKTGGHLVARGLKKIYTKNSLIGGKTEVAAVRDISLEVLPNDFVGILGPSGCGKSTLLGMLSGSLEPTAGSISINGIDIYKNPALIRSMIGMVPQDDIVHGDLSVENAVKMSARLRLDPGIPRSLKEELASQVVSDLGLGDRRKNRISELSGGQRKRASIAVEILKQTQVLFLDEPSSGLDPATEEDLMFQLRHLADQGRTILCTTHVLDRAFLFSKIVFLARGGLVFEGTVDEALSHFKVRNLLDAYRQLDDPTFSTQYGDFGDRSFSFPAESGGSAEKTLKIQLFRSGCVAAVSGRIDGDPFEPLKALAGKVSGSMVVDFSNCQDDSPKLGPYLYDLCEELDRQGCSLSVASPGRRLMSFIKENRYESLIHDYPDLSSAILSRRLGRATESIDADSISSRSNTMLIVLAIISIVICGAFAAMVYILWKNQKAGGEQNEQPEVGFSADREQIDPEYWAFYSNDR